MTRVLHLIDQPGPAGDTLTLRLSVDFARASADQGERHAWLLIGGRAMRDSADAVGLDPASVRLFPTPAGLTTMIPGAMRCMRDLICLADRVVCWTRGAAQLASRLGCADGQTRFGQATLCEFALDLITAGLSKMPGDPQHERQSLRQRWAVPDDAVIVGLLADRPDKVDISDALLALAFSYEVLDAYRSPRRDLRLICHPDAGKRLASTQLTELLSLPNMLIQEPGLLTPWHTLQGCDLVLAPDPRHAGLSLAWAHAMGLPIIAPLEPCLPAMSSLRNLHPAQSAAPRHLSKAMTDWAMTGQATLLTVTN